MSQENNSKFVPGLPDDDDNSVKTFEGVAECTIDDSDTFKSVKLRAQNLAQENVQKKIAEHVYAFWKDRRLTLPADETLSIAAEISNITDVKYNMQDSDGDKMIIRAVVTAQVDDNDVMNYIIKFFKERAELKSEIENLRKENSELKAQNDFLRKEADELKFQRDKISREMSALEVQNKDLKRQLDELKPGEDKTTVANQKANEAYVLFLNGYYSRAIKLYNEAIELNPNSYNSYIYRSRCYQKLGDEAKAQADYKKALSLGH